MIMFSHRDSFVFLAGANVGKVNVVGFSIKKEMEVFIWCTLDWPPMHSFAARYFCYHNNFSPSHDWSNVCVLSSLIGGILTRHISTYCLHFTISEFRTIFL